MEQILIAVFFIINGEPTLVEGWYPMQLPSMEVCEEAKILVEQQLEHMTGDSVVFCGTVEEIQSQLDNINDIEA